MISTFTGSRQHIVNIFAEHILSQLDENSNGFINVVDCKNFYVVKGITDSKSQINLMEVLDTFKDKFSSVIETDLRINVIDLIEYIEKVPTKENLEFIFFNSKISHFHSDQINKSLELKESYEYFLKPIKQDDNQSFIQSQFPYGCSIESGKKLFYLSKLVSSKIIDDHNLNYVVISSQINEDDTLNFKIKGEKTISFELEYKNISELTSSNLNKILFSDLTNPISDIIILE